MLKSNHVFVKRTAPLGVVFLAMTALFLGTCTLQADVWNKKTVMTFSESVEIGGHVLPAGTYVFKLMDSPSNRHIVQILNEEENHVYATVLTIPKYRARPADDTVVQFDERPSTQPQAIRAWFYPGELMGEEFVSSEPRMLVADASQTTTTSSVATVTARTEVEPVVETPAPQPSELSDAEPTPPAPFAEESVEPEPQDPPTTPATPAPSEPSAETLPQTASNLPLAALAGLSSLLAAGVLRLIRKS